MKYSDFFVKVFDKCEQSCYHEIRKQLHDLFEWTEIWDRTYGPVNEEIFELYVLPLEDFDDD